MNEFELIRAFFAECGAARADVALGVGDDCALLTPPAGHALAVTTDTLTADVHFARATDPRALGHKALAVNLSDLAAMGAEPAWLTLAVTLPEVDRAWLAAFADGFCALAREQGARLVGGDTTHGPLSITVTAHGFVPRGQALTRAGARAGDLIYVTGLLGEAGIGLVHAEKGLTLPSEYLARALARLHSPAPRVREGMGLRGLASACIDVSDGLVADLGHVLAASGVGARLDLKRLPVSPAFDAAFATLGWDVALAHGDDYELCFTVPPQREAALHRVAAAWGCGASRIGVIEAEPGLRIIDEAGRPYTPRRRGYDHFGPGA